MKLGTAMIAILRTVANGDWFDSSYITPRGVRGGKTAYRACLKLHERKLLQRDPQDSYRFTATETGARWIRDHDEELERAINRRKADGGANIVMRHEHIKA